MSQTDSSRRRFDHQKDLLSCSGTKVKVESIELHGYGQFRLLTRRIETDICSANAIYVQIRYILPSHVWCPHNAKNTEWVMRVREITSLKGTSLDEFGGAKKSKKFMSYWCDENVPAENHLYRLCYCAHNGTFVLWHSHIAQQPLAIQHYP